MTRGRTLQASPQEKVGIGAYFKRSQPPDGDGLEVKVRKEEEEEQEEEEQQQQFVVMYTRELRNVGQPL